MEGFCNPILAFIVGFTRNRPIIGIASLFRLRMIELLVELEVQSMLDGTTAVWVVKYYFVVGVFMISDTCLVPIPTRRCPMRIALKLVERWRHLEFIDRKHQLLHFQAAVVVNGIEIGDLAVLVIERPMKIIGIPNTNGGIYKRGVVRRINRKMKQEDAITFIKTCARLNPNRIN